MDKYSKKRNRAKMAAFQAFLYRGLPHRIRRASYRTSGENAVSTSFYKCLRDTCPLMEPYSGPCALQPARLSSGERTFGAHRVPWSARFQSLLFGWCRHFWNGSDYDQTSALPPTAIQPGQDAGFARLGIDWRRHCRPQAAGEEKTSKLT